MAKKILVVEDEESLRRTLGDLFKEEGFDFVEAFDGEEGLKKAKQEHPDIILLDLILPKMEGFDVLKTLKTEDETKDIPVIVLTNLESPQDIQRAIDAGAHTYLVKANYSLEEVLSKVKKTLQEAQ